MVLDDVAWRSKMLWETSVVHGVSKCLWARPFRTEATSVAVITVPTLLRLHVVLLWAVPLAHLRFQLSAWSAQPIVG
jgi:hypothetical protein